MPTLPRLIPMVGWVNAPTQELIALVCGCCAAKMVERRYPTSKGISFGMFYGMYKKNAPERRMNTRHLAETESTRA